MSKPSQEQMDAALKLLQGGRLDEAWDVAESLLKDFPESPQAYIYAADTASLRGERAAAIEFMEGAVRLTPGNGLVLLRKAQLLFNDSRRKAAREAALEAATLIGPDERQLRALSRILTDCQDLAGAHDLLLAGHEVMPRSIDILADLAVTEFHLNLPEAAEGHIETLLALEPFHPTALHLRSQLRTQTADSNHLEDLQERLANAPEHPRVIASANYALAKEYEDLQRFDESFEALVRGATAQRSAVSYDAADELSALRDIRESFTADALASLKPGFDAEGPIFIVGMPRTGTTLVERLLASHSQVISIGEFSDFPMMLRDQVGRQQLAGGTGSQLDLSLAIDFEALGRQYMAAARDLAGDSPRFVDKLPVNFLYCGYIQAALPAAKLIHVTRDPLDTCYAVFKTLFAGAYPFSYDPDELADYYISYREHMAHWHRVMPGRILDVSYETLVTDQEGESKRILEWCGLPWEDAVMEFHKQDSPSMTASALQVRKPVYTESIGAWERAGDGLDALRRKLEEAGLVGA